MSPTYPTHSNVMRFDKTMVDVDYVLKWINMLMISKQDRNIGILVSIKNHQYSVLCFYLKQKKMLGCVARDINPGR